MDSHCLLTYQETTKRPTSSRADQVGLICREYVGQTLFNFGLVCKEKYVSKSSNTHIDGLPPWRFGCFYLPITSKCFSTESSISFTSASENPSNSRFG